MNIHFTLIEGTLVVLKLIVLTIGYRFNASNVCVYVIHYIYHSLYIDTFYTILFLYILIFTLDLAEMDMFNLIHVLK